MVFIDSLIKGQDPHMRMTVVIPAYNEAKNIAAMVDSIEQYRSAKDIDCDIIIVDDGSVDDTAAIARDLSAKYKGICLLELQRNYGKGKAVREGMLRAQGDCILFIDADGSTSIGEFDKMQPLISGEKDVIIGTRKAKGAHIIEHQPFLREFLGKGFSALSNFIMQVHVTDFTCGFKCFSRRAARDIFSRSVINDWSFDAEILHIAKKRGYEITEVPVTWKNNRTSKVRLAQDVFNTMKGLLRIRLNSLKGRY